MIDLTGMNNKEFILNADHIEKIEEVPETLITLTNGRKYIVLESVDEVKDAVLRYKNRIFTSLLKNPLLKTEGFSCIIVGIN